MKRRPFRRSLLRLQRSTGRISDAFRHFFHLQAASGIALIAAAVVALIWANSPWTDSYYALWHASLSLRFASFGIAETLHFGINEALMTVFFLVVGMEIRREIHNGALSNLRQAALPIAAALGGVAVPAAIYLTMNHGPIVRDGWAVPMATDIAFAVGVLALLGRSVPGSVRVFLLALAIIDDIIAVLVIALFYSDGISYVGFLIGAVGILMVLAFQAAGVASAFVYVIPGAILWWGLLQAGVHPTLAGVILGLMTPVRPLRARAHTVAIATRAVDDLRSEVRISDQSLQQLKHVHRELLPPVVRVQEALHPWVAFGVMPLFALANAGVSLSGFEADAQSTTVLLGVAVGLVVGKPLGIAGATWLAVRFGGCQLPVGMNWVWVWLIGLLAGIGFTMAVFIATLGLEDPALLSAAKMGILLASLIAAIGGLGWGMHLQRRQRAEMGMVAPA